MENFKNKNILMVIVLVVLVVVAYFGYSYWTKQNNSPEAQAQKLQEQKNTILEKVGALVEVPNEEPVMFTVNDANLLKSQQAFFKDAENGDVLLVYQTNSKAIIYREKTNKIVNSGPVSFQQPNVPVKK